MVMEGATVFQWSVFAVLVAIGSHCTRRLSFFCSFSSRGEAALHVQRMVRVSESQFLVLCVARKGSLRRPPSGLLICGFVFISLRSVLISVVFRRLTELIGEAW